MTTDRQDFAASGSRHAMARAAGAAVLSRPRLFLVLLCLASWVPGLFTLPPGDRDESRFAQATKQMIETGDYVRIMNGQEARNRKPIGIHWLQAPFAIAARAAGIAASNPIWPYRLPSLLGAIAAVLATFETGTLLGRSRRCGLLAGAMLAACTILAVETHIAKTDAALLGAVAVAMAVLAEAWMGEVVRIRHAMLFWAALAAGILLKGPVAPMVVGLAAASLAVCLRSGRFLLALRPGWGAAVLLVMVLPWFAAIGFATHGAFFSQAVGGDLGSKLAGGAEAHGGFPGLHFLLLPLLAFPATVPVLRVLPRVWATRRQAEMRLLLAWVVPSWLVFEAIPTKLPHYTLPLYPALFVAASMLLLGARDSAPHDGGQWRVVSRALAVLAGAAIGVAALALPVVLHGPWWLGGPAALSAAWTAWACWNERLLLALAAALPLHASLFLLELPRLDALWLAPRVEAALDRDWPERDRLGGGVVVAGYAEPSLMFLGGTRLIFVPTGASAARELAGGRAILAVVEGHDVADFEAACLALKLEPHRLQTVDGFNYSRGRQASLALFRPSPAPASRR